MAMIAGCGWLLDASVYWFLADAGLHVFIANIIGNCVGITFTFVLSSRHAFQYHGDFSFRHFILYTAFAFAMMPIFSGLLSWIYHSGFSGLIGAKIIVTVPSFIVNYIFMRLLINKKHA
tara:strand:- start:1849 stop:2205 length:357 start_codon:yes stop_codon:yes gene_type:complete